MSLLVDERRTPERRAIFEQDPELVTWWATAIECTSALSRLDREGRLEGGMAEPMDQLRLLAGDWLEVAPVEEVRQRAVRLLRFHRLRGADALQLAAALTVASDVPETLDLVCSDDRLSTAARREGFRVL